MYDIKEYLTGIDNYLQDLKDLEKTNPEEARKRARESLIRSGVLDKDGNVKEHICNREMIK